MKRYGSLILCFAVLLSLLSGCTSEPEASEPLVQTTEPTVPTYTTEPAVVEIPPIPDQTELCTGDPQTLEEWLFTNYSQSFTWQDQNGNLCHASLTLPALTPVAEFAVEFNMEMRYYGELMLEDIHYAMEDGFGSHLLSADYKSWMNGDILSLLMTIHLSEGNVRYIVRNFDLKNREELSVARLCQDAMGMDYPTFLLAANHVVSSCFEKQYASTLPTGDTALLSEDELALLESYSKTLDRIGLDTMELLSRKLFLVEEGQPVLVYNVPVPATSYGITSRTYSLVEFDIADIGWETPPTEANAYHELFYLTYEVDGAYSEAYSVILQTAFFADPSQFITAAAKESDGTRGSIAMHLSYALTETQTKSICDACNAVIASQETRDREKAFADLVLTQLGY